MTACRGDLWSPDVYPWVPPRGTRRFFEGGFAGFLSEAPPAPPTRPGPRFLSQRKRWERKGRGVAPGTPQKTGAHGGGGLYRQGKNQPRIAARFVGTSFRSFASPQAAKLTPSTVPLLPSRHCDSRAEVARQSRRSFFPALFIRHRRRFAGKLSPPNPLRSRWRLCRLTDAACPLRVLRWASAGAPCSLTFQALPRLGRHASGLLRKP